MAQSGSNRKYLPIPSARLYSISEDGVLRKAVNRGSDHKHRNRPWRYMRGDPSGRYLRYTIVDNDGEERRMSAHRLVYETWVGALDDKLVIAHKDGDASNNHWSNLEQVTQKTNIGHKRAHGTWQSCERHPNASHTEGQADAVRSMLISARRTASGRLARGELHRICGALQLDYHFVAGISRSRGAWE